MSEFVEWLNSASESLVLFGVRMLIQSSVLILAILVLDFALRKRIKAVVRYWIWLLVLVKLVLPPSLSSPTSLAWWLGDTLPGTPAILTDASVEQQQEILPLPAMPQTALREAAGGFAAVDPAVLPAPTNEAAPRAPAVPAAVAPTWQTLLTAGWLAVVVVMLVLLIQRAAFVRGLVLQSQEAPKRMRDLLDRCRRQMAVRGPVHLRLTSLSASPSVCGLVRPTILVPQRMLSQLHGGQLKSVLLHELAHVRRADLWVNLAQTLLQIAYVCHPLVWLANAIIRKVREQAVDETVLAAMGDEAEEYPRTLLTVSKLAFDRPALSLRLVGVVESKKMLAARIRHIVSRPFPTSAKLGLLGVAFVFAVAVALLPMAGRTQASATTTPDEQKIPAQFKATLSNGLTVEVLGIREFPGAGASWWRPDGSPGTGETLPEFRTTDPDYTDPNARVRVLAIRLDGPSLQGVALSHPRTHARESSIYPRYQDDQRKVLQPIQTFIAGFPDDAATTDLKIGIAAGAWKSAAAGSHGQTIAHARDNIAQRDVIYHPVREQNGSLHITATHLLGTDYDCRIVAEDEARNVFEPVRYSNSGGQMTLCTSVLNVPLAQVNLFRLQARPYEWVEFKDIRLMPESHDPKAATQAVSGGSRAAPALTPDNTGTTISGVVVDSAGKPISDAYVSVENADLLVLPEPMKFGAQMRKVKRVVDMRTDLQGHFRITDLNPGKTGISVAAQGYRTESIPDVLTGADGLRVVLNEPRPHQLSGVVVDDSGRGVPDAEVAFIEKIFSEREDDRSPTTLRTDGTGAFRLDRVLLPMDFQSASREFFVRKPGYGLAIRAVDTTGGEPFVRIVLSGQEHISGTVQDDAGKPVAGAAVALRSWWGQRSMFSFSPVSQHLSPQARTDANGSFTLSQVPTESDVFLIVQAQGYAPGDLRSVRTGRFGSYALQRERGWTTMGNTDEPNAPLVITLQKAVTLRGSVVYEGAGEAVPAMRLITQAQRGGAQSETVTDAAGRFEMIDVSPVPCNLLALTDGSTRDIMPDWTAAAIRLNDLQPGETRDNLQLVLTKGDLIRGRVTDSQGQPLQGIDIAFYSAARPRPGAACQTTLTAADGTWAYRFPPGRVYIYIRTDLPGASWQRKEYLYDVAAGQTIENVDFVLNQEVPENSRYRGILSPQT